MLPNQIDPTQPPDTQDIALGATRIRELRQAIIDIFGLPAATNIVQALFAADAAGLKIISLADNAANPTVDGQIVRNGSTILAQVGGVTYTIAPPGGTGGPARPTGQCRLLNVTGTLSLRPFMGNQIAFPAGLATVPAGGVNLGTGGLLASTTYNIFAVQTAGVVTSLEATTNPHTTDASTGIEIRTAFPTRVLVGLARTSAGIAWSDTNQNRFTLSWFNRRAIRCLGSFTAQRSTASGVSVEINSEIRCNFLTWGDEAIQGEITGGQSNDTVSNTVTQLGVDGTPQAASVSGGLAAGIFPIGLVSNAPFPEGFHFASIYGYVGSGTGSWITGTQLGVVIRG